MCNISSVEDKLRIIICIHSKVSLWDMSSANICISAELFTRACMQLDQKYDKPVLLLTMNLHQDHVRDSLLLLVLLGNHLKLSGKQNSFVSDKYHDSYKTLCLSFLKHSSFRLLRSLTVPYPCVLFGLKFLLEIKEK